MKDSEAFLSILIVAVACDGRIRNDEAAALRKVLENRRLFADISEREMSEMTLTISENISSAGFTTVLDSAISSLSVCYHDSVVAVATYLVGVDRHLKQDEHNFLEYLETHQGFQCSFSQSMIIKSLLAFNEDKMKEIK
jgi:hypothetical protein